MKTVSICGIRGSFICPNVNFRLISKLNIKLKIKIFTFLDNIIYSSFTVKVLTIAHCDIRIWPL